MKPFLLSVVLALGLSATGGMAQSYSITGQPATGGGAMQGGRFQITACSGQPEASAPLATGCWTVAPGFWGTFSAMQTPNAPTLRVRLLPPDRVWVSFPPGCGDWVLQWTTAVGAEAAETAWTDDLPANLSVAGEELVRDFHVPSWGPRLFFRLRRQP